jgi:hypothetical protein
MLNVSRVFGVLLRFAFRTASWRGRKRARHTAVFHCMRGIKQDRRVESLCFAARYTAWRYRFYTKSYCEFHQFVNVPHHTGTKLSGRYSLYRQCTVLLHSFRLLENLFNISGEATSGARIASESLLHNVADIAMAFGPHPYMHDYCTVHQFQFQCDAFTRPARGSHKALLSCLDLSFFGKLPKSALRFLDISPTKF